jgi:hypothetical protein
MLTMAMGRPLQAGTYYIGLKDPSYTNSYSVLSRGIGLTNYSIAVHDLGLTSGSADGTLPADEADYYRVQIPTNTPDWKLKVSVDSGDVLLKVRSGFIPTTGAGQLMMQPGDEQWALLPDPYPEGNTNLDAGPYFALVASQGQNVPSGLGTCPLGSGTASYHLASWVEPVTVAATPLGYGTDLFFTNSQQNGEMKFYQFTAGALAALEVSFLNPTGVPILYLSSGVTLTGTAGAGSNADPYGHSGGFPYGWCSASLITVANPPPGPFSLSVFAESDTAYVIRIHAVPPMALAFDGGSFTATNQPAGQWQFFQVTVPADALGWDVRFTGATTGSPQYVVCRGGLPGSVATTSPWSEIDMTTWIYYPNTATNWPSTNQLTLLNSMPALGMGMGNPLQPDTYYIGVEDPSSWHNPVSYTIQSGGIGPGHSIPVPDLGFSAGTATFTLPPTEAAYYRVTVPDNAPSWKLKLKISQGSAVLKVQKDFLPFLLYGQFEAAWGAVFGGQGGQEMTWPGDQQWTLLPLAGQSYVTPGSYFISVINHDQTGTVPAVCTLTSQVAPVATPPGPLAAGADLLFTNSQQCGELSFYQFTVPAGIAAFDVRLEEASGSPLMFLNPGPAMCGTWDWYPGNYYHGPSTNSDAPYGNYGGASFRWTDPSIITVPNPQPGVYNLSIAALQMGAAGNIMADAAYVVRVQACPVLALSSSPELNTAGLTNVAAATLADGQRAFYQVTVPADVAGAPVLGWYLELSILSGSPSVRVRPGSLPDDLGPGATPFNSPSATVVPPYLTPGTWYVEVKGSGASSYSLSSLLLTTNTLEHPAWSMPALGQTTTAPGLSLPAIGDSGIDAAGNPLPDDQGLDLAQGNFHFYAVLVPTNNAGLLRAEVQAISGYPALYARVGAAPTLSHDGTGTNAGGVYDRSLVGNTTKYGNWVPQDGRYESELTPGLWVLGVQAAGNASARYRLQLACGNSIPNGLVQDLALDGGSYTNQTLSGGDWRYYRVWIPSNAPANWTITWSRTQGAAQMCVRDTVPPGIGSSGVCDWSTDWKNQGPYPRDILPGGVTLNTPPLRPGSFYYLGFSSATDSTFWLNSAVSGGTVSVNGTLPPYGGAIAASIPADGALLYLIDAPSLATHLKFNCVNSAAVLFGVEQGTLAQAGGPAHWYSWGQTNIAFDEALSPAGRGSPWPWMPGYTYYLAITNTSSTAQSLSLTTPEPADLAPIVFNAPPFVTSPLLYPEVQVVYCVTNRGPASAAGPWTDLVWVSTNGVLDANAVASGYFPFQGVLPPGGSAWVTNTVQLPATPAAAQYTLFLQVDGWNSVDDADANNKVSAGVSVTVTVIPPELAPLAFIVPSPVVAPSDPTLSLVWGVTNLGAGAATGAWADAIYLSTRPVLDGTETFITSFTETNPVAPGAAYWRTNAVRVPVTQSGTYYLIFAPNYQHLLYETTQTNDILAAAIIFTATPPPDLAPIALLAPTLVTNPSFTVVWGVTNQGLGPTFGTWHDQVYIASTPDMSSGFVYVNDFTEPGPLAPGASYWRTNTIEVGSIAKGNYYLIFHANADNGVYEADTTNNTLAVPLTINVSQPPSDLHITGWSFSSQAPAGSSTIFSVTATSSSAIGYQWFKDGAALTNNSRITGATSPNLSISNLQTSDSGSYYVVLTIPSGSLTSADMVLQVSAGLIINVWPQDQPFTAGGTAVFSVSVSGGTPPFTYQWSHNGVPLINGGRISGANTNTLTIQNLVTNDLGTYSVSIQDSAGSLTILSAQLKQMQNQAPTILSQPAGQTVHVGQPAFFNVLATGPGPITYQWRRNQGPLANQTNTFLSIASAQLSDAGDYSVVVGNPAGSVTSKVATLVVSIRTNLPTNANVAWVRQAGGAGWDEGHVLALDPSGNLLVAGYFGSADGGPPPSGYFGTNLLAGNGQGQFFVAQYDTNGNCLWARTAPGTASSDATSVAADAQTNVFVAGIFNGSAVFGSTTLVSTNASDAFLAKLDSHGQFLWAIAAGRTNAESIVGLASVVLDTTGNAFWASTFSGTMSLGTNTLIARGTNDVFLAKVSPAGALLRLSQYGTPGCDLSVSALAMGGGATNLFLAGNFSGSAFLGTNNLVATGSHDVFLAKLDGSGSVLWALRAGSTSYSGPPALTVDSSGKSYLAGDAGDALFFNAGSVGVTNVTPQFGYLLQVSSNGVPLWVRKAINTGGARAVALDHLGRPLAAGWVGLPFDDEDIFLARFDTAGNLSGLAFAGGPGNDEAQAVVAAADGSIYLTGDFEAGAAFGTNTLAGFGESDIFVAKLAGVNPPHSLQIYNLSFIGPDDARLSFGYNDHVSVEANLPALLRVLAANDLKAPLGQWQVLTNIVVTPGNELQLDDSNASVPRRFYLLQEAP